MDLDDRQPAESAAAPDHGPDLPAGDLERALGTLAPHLRATVELRFVDGLGHADVARVLGISERTAKGWARQALDVLRERLTKEP